MEFLERSDALAFLQSRLQGARQSQGSLVFVSGEMGIGKTSLINQFLTHLDNGVRVTQAPFDALSIPEPLGPFHYAFKEVSPELHQLFESEAPKLRLFNAFVDEMRSGMRTTVLVMEDVHWADEASLDFLRFLARRVKDLSLVSIATLRDDELPPDHPLRRVIGDLVNVPAVHRLPLPTLSLEAVAELALDSDLDPVELHAYTGGNPFFVSEIVASGSQNPMSLQDAILGRAARLDPDHRDVLDAAATIGAQVPGDVLECVTGRSIVDAVDQGLAVGLLRPTLHGVEFRHAAVHSILRTAISAVRRQALHKRILACLLDHPAYQNDVARLAFHAEEARDPSTFDYAIAAARRATAFQSHREAAEQYARALRWADHVEPEVRAKMLEAQAYSYYLTTRFDDAIVSQETASGVWQSLGRNLDYGHNLRRLSRFCLFASRHRDAIRLAERAHEVLSNYPGSRELALASGYLAEWRMRSNANPEAIALARQAMDIAHILDDEDVTAHALITEGTVRFGSGDETGIALLEQGLARSRELGHEEFVLRALTHLAEPPGFRRPNPQSRERYIGEGIEYGQKHGLDTKIVLFGGMNVRFLLDSAQWSRANEEAEKLIANPSARGHYLFEILLSRGLARLRSGKSSPEDFQHAAALARELNDNRYMAAVNAALVESAWLRGDDHRARTLAMTALEEALACDDIGTASTLALWTHRAGQLQGRFPWLPEPYALEITGEWEAAADMWDEDGVPLEALRARSASTTEADLRTVHAGLERISAHPDAMRVARRLRALGFRHVPRGPRPSTRATYGTLTRREVEILGVLATGASNRDIAQQCFLSPKTVEHHISAILGKLGVSNRQQAVNRARDAGLIPK